MNEYFYPLSEAYQLAHDLEKLKADFRRVGEEQRGEPEYLMSKFVEALGNGGVHPFIAEHVGDLSHRASLLTPRGEPAGYEYVTEKVRKCLRTLTNAYGFDKERLENLKNNALWRYKQINPKVGKEYQKLENKICNIDRNINEDAWYAAIEKRNAYYQQLLASPEVIKVAEEFDANARAIGKEYAMAHRTQVHPLTTLQRLGQQAAIAVGEYNFFTCVNCLEKMDSRIKEADKNGTLDKLWFEGYQG